MARTEYTAQELRAIRDGWHALQRAVESNREQTERVEASVKSLVKGGVHREAAQCRVMDNVRMGLQSTCTVRDLAKQPNDTILCYMAGAWLAGQAHTCELLIHLQTAVDSWGVAQRRRMEAIR